MPSHRLSQVQKDALIAHIDGPQLVRAGDPTPHGLVRMGFLRFHFDHSKPQPQHGNGFKPRRALRPTHTTLTDDGRQALAGVLAWLADALSRGGIEVQVESMIEEALRRAEVTNRSDRLPAPVGQEPAL